MLKISFISSSGLFAPLYLVKSVSGNGEVLEKCGGGFRTLEIFVRGGGKYPVFGSSLRLPASAKALLGLPPQAL